MSDADFHIVLYEPEIPPNTGNIIRLAANTGARLHLIKPLGFEWSNTRLKRAGLDYHDLAHVELHDSLAAFEAAARPQRVFALSTRGRTSYSEPSFHAGDTFLFGPETRGLPDEVLHRLPPDRRLRIPMRRASRSLNLANAVAVVLYEASRQLGYEGLS